LTIQAGLEKTREELLDKSCRGKKANLREKPDLNKVWVVGGSREKFKQLKRGGRGGWAVAESMGCPNLGPEEEV